VKGAVTVTASSETCVAAVSGRVDDSIGQTVVSVWCAPPTVADPRAKPSREFSIELPDPRVLDATSPAKATERTSSAGVSTSAPVNAKVEILEAAGRKAPLPSSVTNDFVRHFVVRMNQTGVAEVNVDVTIRSNDLREPEQYCAAD
jgi:hypothetical protein